MKYKINITLSENCLDEKGNIKPYEVLNLFQVAANNHGNLLGVSFEEMLKKNLLWVVTRTRYEICGTVTAGQEVEVITWPLNPSRLGYERDYIINDIEGNLIIKGTSNWAVIDADTRRLASTSNLYNTDNLCTERAFADRAKRIRNFEATGQSVDLMPDSSLIDMNGHVNNTHYATFAQKALGGYSGKIKFFQIDYHHEVMCYQPLKMFTSISEDLDLVKGEDVEGTLMFCCSVQYI